MLDSPFHGGFIAHNVIVNCLRKALIAPISLRLRSISVFEDGKN